MTILEKLTFSNKTRAAIHSSPEARLRKKMIEAQLQKIGERFKEETVTYTVMMEGDGNFRSRLATIRPYKGNRGANLKPLMFNKIRQYLQEAWDAKVVYDIETDDQMAIMQTQYNRAGQRSVIVGVDKDMLQVPGWHLNPKKGFKKISRKEGKWRLYVQALQGDPVDNIMGAFKVGAAAAQKRITIDMSEQEMWDALVAGYALSMEKYPSKYPEGMTAHDAALENMRLVYLLRDDCDRFVPPGERNE
jgi:hypothetical protein